MRTAIGLMVGVGAYTAGLWAWCLITGRNVSLYQLTIGSVSTWPPSAPSAAAPLKNTAPTGGGPANDVQTGNGVAASTTQFFDQNGGA
jgi:hypothetical protein